MPNKLYGPEGLQNSETTTEDECGWECLVKEDVGVEVGL